ncbi:MAG: hypothetical protein Q7S00_06850, partial [bacterium]|nr:hypothetical protein [bacterium]
PFGYDSVLAEIFSPEESLLASFDSDFTDAPFQLLEFFKSMRAGDLILTAAKGYDLRASEYEKFEHRGTHGSLLKEHMQIPLYMNAPLPARPLRSADLFPLILQSLIH